MVLHALLLHLALMRPVPPFVGTGPTKSAPCASGACSFTWSGPAGQGINAYNSGFQNLSTGHTMSAVTLDGVGHVQIAGFSVAGARYTGSTSEKAQIVFAAAAGASSSLVKGLCVDGDGTNDGYCVEPCFNDGTGKWLSLCTKKNGTILHQSAGSSYDPTVDETVRIAVDRTSGVSINVYWNGTLIDTTADSTSPLPAGSGSPGFYSGDGSASAAQQQFGPFQDF